MVQELYKNLKKTKNEDFLYLTTYFPFYDYFY